MDNTIRVNPIMTRCLTPRQQEQEIKVALIPTLAGDMTVLTRKDEVLKTWTPGYCPTVIEAQEEADRAIEREEHIFDFERQQKVIETMKEEYRKVGGMR